MMPGMPDFDDIIVTAFNEESAVKFRQQLTKRSMFFPESPIIVYVDSYGGQVDAMASMIEAMEQCQNKIITVCTGKAMSCGAILLAAGDYRFCGRHSRVMIHESSTMIGGQVNELKSSLAESERLNNYWLDFLAKRCGMKSFEQLSAILKENSHHDLYLTADIAVKFGICDAIGMPTIKPIVKYGVMTLEARKIGGEFADPIDNEEEKQTMPNKVDETSNGGKKDGRNSNPKRKIGKRSNNQ
jgi:ATP-dependent Clp endopeptidase proteolytic subunit ClpP